MKTHLKVLIISGESHVFAFDPDMTVGRAKELIWSMWPSGECWERLFSWAWSVVSAAAGVVEILLQRRLVTTEIRWHRMRDRVHCMRLCQPRRLELGSKPRCLCFSHQHVLYVRA